METEAHCFFVEKTYQIRKKRRMTLEKNIYRDLKPKKPIGQKHMPMKMSEYEPREDFSIHIKRIKMRFDE